MSKSKYRLQPVLEVRERAKQEAAKVVALRRAQLDAAGQELERREGELALCRGRQQDAHAKMLEEAQGGAEARSIVAHRTHLADLRRQEGELLAAIEEQRAVVARAERELEDALARLAEASKDARVIEKHRENWREGERRTEQRREQKIGDEIAALLHGRGAK